MPERQCIGGAQLNSGATSAEWRSSTLGNRDWRRVIEIPRAGALQRKAGAANVESLKGEIEAIPPPDNSVDVIISNCVINLSADQGRALREAFRVLKPGGRFPVSDVVTRGDVPEQVRKDMLLWVGCIAGALEESDCRAKLAAAGFEAIRVEPTRVYQVDEAREFLAGKGLDVDRLASQVDGKFMSALVRAAKPKAAAN